MPELNNQTTNLLKIGNLSYKMCLAVLAAILFSAYSPNITSELPDTIRVFFENNIARFSIIVLIIYLGNHNLELSLLIAVAISLMMSLVHKYEIKEALANKIHEDFFIKKDSLEQFENNDKNKLITHLSHQIDDLHDNLLDTLNNKKGTILGESSETGKSEENDHSDGLNHLEESGHSEEDGHLDESSHSETSHPLHPLSEEDVSISQIHKQVSNHPVTQTNQDSTQSIKQSNPNTSSTQASSLNKEPFISNKQNQKYKLNEIQSNVNSIIQKYKGLLDPKNNLIVN